MPEFICVTANHWGRLWKIGQTYIGDECPNKHFKPLEDNGPVKAQLEPANMSEMNVFNMRPNECKIFIKRRYGIDLDTKQKDYPQEALRIMRGNTPLKNVGVPTPENRVDLPEALTKRQYKEKIEEANPGIEIPSAALRSMKALKEFEANIGKEDFLS